MTSTIAHILLLPHPEHRERLLAPGAPVAFAERRGWALAGGEVAWDDGGWTSEPPEWIGIRLVLARDGAVCPEGVDRLARVLGILDAGNRDWRESLALLTLDSEIGVVVGQITGFDRARALARVRTVLAPLGTLVLLDADGEVVGG